MDAPELSVLVTTLAIAAFMDLRTDKVPNVLVAVGFGLTGLLRCLSMDVARIIDFALGAIIPFAV